MRNKILIVSPWHEEKKELEQILAFIPQNGGEIFFTQSEESGLQLLKKEHPQIVFLDEIFASHIEKWKKLDINLVILCQRHTQIDFPEVIHKPFKESQILEKCRKVLNVTLASSPIPPM